MVDRRRVVRRGWKVALLILWLFTALAVTGFNPADPPFSAVTPVPAGPTNPCGPAGAVVASVLEQLFGVGAWILLGASSAGLWSIQRSRPAGPWRSRSIGVGLVLAVVATAAQALWPDLLAERIPIVGAGGYLGATLWHGLGAAVGLWGLVLILAVAGVAGGLLCGDLLVREPARDMLDAWRQFRRGRSRAGVSGPPPSHRLATSTAMEPILAPLPRLPARLPRPAAARDEAERSIPLAPAPSSAPSRAASGVREPIVPTRAMVDYQPPPLSLLDPPAPPVQEHESRVRAKAMLLEQTFREFGVNVRVVEIDTGPVVTQFEIELEQGLRLSRIVGLADDLAVKLAVPSVRIVAPIPGKTTVGVEVPNDRRVFVKLSEIIEQTRAQTEKAKIPLYLGKDVKGDPIVYDLTDMPHLLLAGATNTGKSVCLNALILSILYRMHPEDLKLILFDPKMVELNMYNRIPHLMHPVVIDMKKAETILAWACEKMEERYNFLCRAGVRNIHEYNNLGPDEIHARLNPETEEERQAIPTHLPYIVIIADEFADLVMTAPKEVELHVIRLAQKARAVGIHLIIATQRPTVDVITGLIKSNLPARVAFTVASRNDSRVILDEMGAERLLGKGDMLFLAPGTMHMVRAQGAHVRNEEVEKTCKYLQQYPAAYSKEVMQFQVAGSKGGKERASALKERDELYEAAIEVVVREGRGSCSLLQRALGIGYGRASRLIDFMAEDGIVGEYKAGGPRDVLYSLEEWEAIKRGGSPDSDAERPEDDPQAAA